MKKFLLTHALAAKKKFISVLLLALASVCTINAQTRDTVLVDGLYYILVTGGASPFAYVTSKGDYYTGNFAADQLDYVSGDLVIPSTVTYNAVDYLVTSIDAGAFSQCRRLKSVVIPNTVTHIVGDYRAQFTGAFYGCDSLTSVTLSENLTELGAFAFSFCSALPEITLPAPSAMMLSRIAKPCGASLFPRALPLSTRKRSSIAAPCRASVCPAR